MSNVATQTYPPSDDMAANAHVNAAKYDAMYHASIADPEGFWLEQAQRIDWMKPFTKVKDVDFTFGQVKINWFADGALNVSANCIDRHLETRGDQTAIIWEPDSPDEDAQHISYRALHAKTCKMANILRDIGVGKGDRVIIYMPMIPEAAYAMLACARIGAIHSIVFAGFSPDALAARVQGSDAKVVITADYAPRGGKATPLKANADKALAGCDPSVKCLVVRRTGGDVAWNDARDVDYTALEKEASDTCAPEEMNAEDPLFILYTSGSTGQPKGVVHTTGGYLVYAALTHEVTFDYHDGDVYWCTADVGWVTGHSYIVYGPLANGATTLMFEGVPTYPDASRFWQICEKHKVNQFYTAPTAIRALMGKGRAFVDGCDLSSLKLLGTVGEPINPEAWNWYNDVVGKGNCPIVDTWWQTETGGHLMTPLPGAHATKPGAAMKPFFGVNPVVLDPQSGEEIHASRVISNVNVKRTFLDMVDRSHLPEGFVEDVEGFRSRGMGFKLLCAVDRLPQYAGFSQEKTGTDYPAYAHICPTPEFLEQAFHDAKFGWYSQEPFLSPNVPSHTDPTLAPEGKHVVAFQGGVSPYELRNSDWDKEGPQLVKNAFAVMDRFAPGFSDSVIDYKLYTPKDIEKDINMPGGNSQHGELTLDQIFFMRPVPRYADYRSPVRNLYQCGASTHPGGAVSAVPGHNAAREILRDWRWRTS